MSVARALTEPTKAEPFASLADDASPPPIAWTTRDTISTEQKIIASIIQWKLISMRTRKTGIHLLTPSSRQTAVMVAQPADDYSQNYEICCGERCRRNNGGGNSEGKWLAAQIYIKVWQFAYWIKNGVESGGFLDDHNLALQPKTSPSPARTAVGRSHHIR